MTDGTLPLLATAAVIRRGVEAGLHTGGQVHVITPNGRYGAVVGDDGRGRTMAPDTLMPWFCAARPLLAMAVARIGQTHGLALDDPVAAAVPEFGRRGKGGVTVRHVLTHTTGIRDDPGAGMRATPWPEILERIYDAPLADGWEPGRNASYQAVSYWYVLGELIMRVSGRPLGEYLREEVIKPLGLGDSRVGMTAEEYRRHHGRLGHVTEIAETGLVPADTETVYFCCGHLPFSARGTARDLARFYALLLRPEEMADFLPAALIRDLCAPSRTGLFDHGWGLGGPVDWGVVGMVESRRYGRTAQLFGRHSSDLAFGHYGHRATVGFADPGTGIAAAFSLTGLPDVVSAHLRTQALCTAIYKDVAMSS